jgi:uncharacterized protein YkwD
MSHVHTALPRTLRACVVAAVAAGVLAPAASAACTAADTTPTAANLDQVRHATLCLLNDQRRLHKLHPLRANARLQRGADAYSAEMVAGGFFAHVSPRGSTLVSRVRRTGYLSRRHRVTLGENIAWGSGPLATPRLTVRAWMRSPGHRRNILTARFRDIGVGVSLGAPTPQPGPAAATYTTDFGTG